MGVPSSPDERRRPTAATYRRRRATAVGILIVLVAVVITIATSGGHDTAQSSAQSETPTPAKQSSTTGKTVHETAAQAPAGPQISGEAAKKARIPILMYHVISTPPAGQPMSELWVPKARFQSQVEALKTHGYTAITMEQAIKAWQDGAAIPEKPIVLTFDDGYLTQSTNAGPVLEQLGWKGVLYLTTRNIGPTIPAASVKKLIRLGWELGAHTITHPDLTKLGAADLKKEIEDSRLQLQAEFGQPVNAFCYPTGANNETVRAATKAAGYTSATTVVGGIADGAQDPFALPRVRVTPDDTPKLLLKKIEAFKAGAVPADAPGGYTLPSTQTTPQTSQVTG